MVAFTLQSVLTTSADATGFVEAGSAVQLNFQATAPVLQIDVHPGEAVRAGQVLAMQNVTAIQARLAADQASLSADRQKLSALQAAAGSAPSSAHPAVTAPPSPDAVTLSGAQQLAKDTTLVDAANVAKAGAVVQADQLLVTSDQQQISTTAGSCAITGSISLPPPGQLAPASGPAPALTPADEIALLQMCQGEQRQLAQDRAQLTTAQGAYQEAVAAAKLDTDNYNATVSNDEAQVAADSSSQPSTVAAAAAAVAADQSAIRADQAALDGAVLRAPADGIVASVGGVAGDIASADGVRQFSSPQALPTQPSTGIALFPSAPAQQTTPDAQLASLITLDEAGVKVMAQVGETRIRDVSVGQKVRVRIPALPGLALAGTVAAIDPQAVNNSGKVAYLVEIDVASAPAVALQAASRHGQGRTAGLLPGLSADVSF